MFRFPSATILLVAVSVASCGEPDPYDTSCKTDADCVTVPTGDCNNCTCQMTAINKDEVTRYEEDRADECGDDDNFCGMDCSGKTASCSGNGRCAVN